MFKNHRKYLGYCCQNCTFPDLLNKKLQKRDGRLYHRIIQEGLRNISKHACADHISVSLKGIDHDVLLSVQDDGIGFDPAEVREKPGLGLASMRERTRLIHGEFSISSESERGTVITVRVPLTGREE